MSLTAGELNAYLRLDDSPFVRGLDMAGAKFTEFKARLDSQLAEIDRSLRGLAGTIRVEADVRQAERDVRAMVRRLNALRVNITCNIPIERAQAQLDEIQQRIRAVSRMRANPSVRVESADTLAALRAIITLADRIDRAHPSVRVDANTARAEEQLRRLDRAQSEAGRNTALSRLSSVLGGIGSAASSAAGGIGSVASTVALVTAALGAAIPIAAGLAAALVDIAPAAAVGATAVLSLASAFAAIKIGTGGLGAAFKAAFAPAVGGGGAAVNTARQVADAQRALKDATQQAAYANQAAAEQTARAERQVVDAQKQARQAQQDLNASREQATRDLQDMNESLSDAYVDQEQAVLDLSTAQKQLTKDQQAGADADTIRQDQIDIEKAQRHLEEQDIATKRLQADTDNANKAGVEGSQTMVQARQKVADTNQNLSDQEQALADARQQQARTAAQGLENIQKAQEAMAASAGSAAGGGVNKLGQALAKLSPNARAFVLQVLALRGAWHAMQQAVQNKLFAGLAGDLKSTASTVLPLLRTNLVSTAGALNAMAVGALTAAQSVGKDGALGKAMSSAAGGLHNLAGLPGIFIKALTQVAAAAGPAFLRLTAAMGRGAAALGSALDKAFKSGAMTQAIDTAISLIKELGKIAGNVFSILGSVMGAAQVSGGGFLGVLKQISGALATAFKSDAVQSGLRALFTTMEVLGKTVAPLFVQALGVIAPVLTALGPPVQRLITALGAALSPIIAALGPVLLAAADAVGQLLDAVSPILPVIGQMIAALGPVLTPILKIVGDLFSALAPVLLTLASTLLPPFVKFTGLLASAFVKAQPVLDKAMQQLGDKGLTPIITGLVDVVSSFVDKYGDQFMNAFQQLLPVLPQLVPVFMQLGTSIGQILTAIAPLLPQLTLLATEFLIQLLPAITPLIGPLAQLTADFTYLATGVIKKVVIPTIDALIVAMRGMRAAMQPAIAAVTWLTNAIHTAFSWLYDTLLGHSIIPDIVNGIVRWFASLPGRAWSALANLGSNIASRAKDAGTQLVSAIRRGLDGAVGWVAGLPDRALRALGDLSGTLYQSGRALIGGFVDGISSMWKTAGDAASGILGFVKDHFPNSPAKRGPFSGTGWTMFSGIATAADYIAGLDSQRGAAGNAAVRLMAAAHDNLAAPGTPMGALVTSRAPRAAQGYLGGVPSSASVVSRGRMVVDAPRGQDEFTKLIRKIVKVEGGDVQIVFGTG